VRSLLEEGGEGARQGQIYDPNVVIVEQGTVGHAMYLIHRGEAEVVLNGTYVKKIGAGAHFGEMQLLGLTPMRTATVRSLTICHIFEVKSEVFVRLLLRFRQERRLFEQEAMRRYRDLADVRKQQKRRMKQIEQLGVNPALGSAAPGEEKGKNRGEVRVSITDEMTANLEAAAQGDTSALRSFRTQQKASFMENKSATASTALSQSLPGTSSTRLGTAETMASEAAKTLAIPGELAVPVNTAPRSSTLTIPKADPAPTTQGSTLNPQGPTAALRSRPRTFADLDSDDEDHDEVPKQKMEDENFVQRVARSLRTDTKRGFMAASSSWVPPDNGTWKNFGLEDEDVDPEFAQVLETRLLPPISLLSPVQKQGLLRQLRQQAHSKLRRAQNKLSVGLKVSKALKSNSLKGTL